MANLEYDAFISYSRSDATFVDTLAQLLKTLGYSLYLDRSALVPGAKFPPELYAAIDASAKFLIVLSPDWQASDWCHRELEHAQASGKALIPVLRREVDSSGLNPEISHVEWVDFRDTADQESARQALDSAMKLDIEYVRNHAYLLGRARR